MILFKCSSFASMIPSENDVNSGGNITQFSDTLLQKYENIFFLSSFQFAGIHSELSLLFLVNICVFYELRYQN